jgi:formate-dependent nitrite reductase membrane component NrfD
VPAYFYCGGLSGACAALGAVARYVDREGLDGLVAKTRWVAAAAGAGGTVLLILDLGKPERFLNMLRVFRPTSPMSVGSWVVAGEGPLAAGSAFLSGSRGVLRDVGDTAATAAGALGSVMTGYTAVLLANTAVPIWQQTRRTLPPLFVASAASSAASILELLPLSDREASVVRRFGVVGRVAELVASIAFQKDAARIDQVAKPLHEARAGALWKAAKIFGVASLVASLPPRRSRAARAVTGLLGTAGVLALRFAVAEAGKQSAADPQATFAMQRTGLGSAETVAAGSSGNTLR